ncbi:MAG: class I SAM-dependent methyltransferase, partial [Phycisphaerales bacterium]
ERQRPDLAPNIVFVEGDAQQLPLEDDSVDIALFCLVLHHIEDVPNALLEAKRVVISTGRVFIIDMQEHIRDEYRHTMGHVHLGFSESTLQLAAKKCGLRVQQYHRLHPDTGASGPSLFVAVLTQ